jgi:hypothetical protein
MPIGVGERLPKGDRSMEFTFDLGLAGMTLMVVGAAAFAFIAPLLGKSVEFEGVVDAVVVFAGAFVASAS